MRSGVRGRTRGGGDCVAANTCRTLGSWSEISIVGGKGTAPSCVLENASDAHCNLNNNRDKNATIEASGSGCAFVFLMVFPTPYLEGASIATSQEVREEGRRHDYSTANA
jgi:hypothetical protein